MNGNDREIGLVPHDLDYSGVVRFIDVTLSSFGLLGDEPTVRQYAEAAPDAHRAIRALSTAVAEAGIRVRDIARHPDMPDEHMRLFTADEFWTFDLAIDVIAMFVTGGGLEPGTHALLIDFLRILDVQARSHHWRKEVRKAGDSPPEFRELRAHVPRHQPF